MGVESRRQWSDPALARGTPRLLGRFPLVALAADRLHAAGVLTTQQAPWCAKPVPTFSDALAAVRRDRWRRSISTASDPPADTAGIPRRLIER